MKTSESKAAYRLFSFKPMDLYSELVVYILKKISHRSLMGLHVGIYALRKEVFAERKFHENCEFASKLKTYL